MASFFGVCDGRFSMLLPFVILKPIDPPHEPPMYTNLIFIIEIEILMFVRFLDLLVLALFLVLKLLTKAPADTKKIPKSIHLKILK